MNKKDKLEFETIKSHKNRLYFLCGFVCVVILLIVLITNHSLAKYRTTESIPLINGTINYTSYDLKMVAMYQEENGDYKSIDTVPTSGYSLNEEKSYCEVNDTKDNNITIEYQNGVINFLGMPKKGTKCYLYFDEQILAKDIILANSKINEGEPDFSQVATTDEGIYKAEDDWGESYYFRGDVTNNWIKFEGYYWRIIRINGDGSIRLIYNGTGTATTGTSTQISTSAYNSSYYDNAYVGYMYGSTGASSYAATYANTNNSTIKGVLDNWYQTNITNKGYGDKVSKEAGFCNDRKISTVNRSGYGTLGYGTNATVYAPVDRFLNASWSWLSTQNPTLKCSQLSNDMFTVSGSSKGNKALANPVGLITADEVVFAGGKGGTNNSSYYLYTGQNYWTMSPFDFYDGHADVFFVHSNGNLNYSNVYGAIGVRPVINLAYDVEITGSGTSSDPYVVV